MNISTKFIISIFAIFLASISITEFTSPAIGHSSGAPAGKTGSPGDASNCTSCHAGTPTSQAGLITTNIPVAGYTPGQTYTILRFLLKIRQEHKKEH